MSEVIRIQLVEDQYFARIALHALIDGRDDMEIVAETALGSEAPRLFREHRPDLVVMDLRLPGMDGFEAIAAIRREDPAAKIVVLSNYEGSEDVHRAVQAGAMAYLTKDTNAEEILAAILAVHRGKRYLPVAVSALLSERMTGSELTDREREVLELVTKGMNNREIAERLGIAEKTAKTHMSRVLDKLGVEDRTQAALAAIRRGIVHLS